MVIVVAEMRSAIPPSPARTVSRWVAACSEVRSKITPDHSSVLSRPPAREHNVTTTSRYFGTSYPVITLTSQSIFLGVKKINSSATAWPTWLLAAAEDSVKSEIFYPKVL